MPEMQRLRSNPARSVFEAIQTVQVRPVTKESLQPPAGSPLRERPEQLIVPYPGSERFAQDVEYWTTVIKLTCIVCGEPLGGGWALRWEPERWAHLHCWDEKCEAERALGDNPWLSEESAKRHGLTIATFRELPSYERIQMNRHCANPPHLRPTLLQCPGEFVAATAGSGGTRRAWTPGQTDCK